MNKAILILCMSSVLCNSFLDNVINYASKRLTCIENSTTIFLNNVQPLKEKTRELASRFKQLEEVLALMERIDEHLNSIRDIIHKIVH
uniref:Secreted protein n=2 Tax=Caenorhabditis tropicalis TaxID=1561998 RepID=A0A1I7V0X5_9PELO